MKKKVILFFLFFVIVVNHLYMYNVSSKTDYTESYSSRLNLKENDEIQIDDNEIIQTITSTRDEFYGINIYLDPIDENYDKYKNSYLTAYLIFKLTDEDGNLIDEYKYEKIFFSKVISINFEFPKIKNSEGKKYYLHISSYKDNKNIKFKLAKEKDGSENKLYVNNKESDYSLIYTTSYKIHTEDNLFMKLSLIIISCFILLLIFINRRNFKIHDKYLIISLVVSLFMILLTPLYCGNDEVSHWSRIYEISRGDYVSSSKDGWPTSIIPVNVLETEFNDYNYLYSQMTREYATDSIDVDMQYTSVYSPLSYFPQIIGLKLAKIFTNNTFIWPYISRIFEALFSIICIYFAIKIIPFGKNILFIIGFIPSLVLSTSLLSADAVLISSSILFIAKILEISYTDKNISKFDYLLLFILSVLISVSKLVYFPICFLLILIPLNKKNNKKTIKNIIVILIISLLVTLLWNSLALKNLTSGQGINVSYYIKYYLKNPLEFIQISIYTFFNGVGNFVSDLFGGNNSWYGTTISDASIFPILMLIIYIIYVIKSDNKLVKRDKIIIFSIILFIYFLIQTSLLLTCTPVHYSEIVGIQGRYFIPLLLLIYLVFSKEKENKINLNLDYIIILFYMAYYLRLILIYI